MTISGPFQQKGCRPIPLESLAARTNARTFALRIEDEAMQGRHILPGDFIVLENGITPRPGDVVAALVDGDCVVRTYAMDGNKPCLRAAHPALVKSIPADDVVVQGVMVRLIRQRPKG